MNAKTLSSVQRMIQFVPVHQKKEEDKHPAIISPSLADLDDFSAFVNSKRHVGESFGFLKLIMPTGWQSCTGLPNFKIDGISQIQYAMAKDGGIEKEGVFQRTLKNLPSMTIADFQSRFENTTPKNVTLRELANLSLKEISTKAMEKRERSKIVWPAYAFDVDAPECVQFSKPLDLRNLGTILDRHKEKYSGVVTPMLYFGTFGSTFTWHQEDGNLYSISVSLGGDAKMWIVSPNTESAKIKSAMEALLPKSFEDCREVMRHKRHFPTLQFLEQHGIKYQMVFQHAGEIMITFPGAFHFGTNLGLNLAAAVNFATKNWLMHGIFAKYCDCSKKSHLMIHWEDLATEEQRNAVNEVLNGRKPLSELEDLLFPKPGEKKEFNARQRARALRMTKFLEKKKE